MAADHLHHAVDLCVVHDGGFFTVRADILDPVAGTVERQRTTPDGAAAAWRERVNHYVDQDLPEL